MPWEVLEHTADVGLTATGPNLEAAIGDLVAGFGRLLCPDGTIGTDESHRFEVPAKRLEDAVMDLLDELNFVHQMQGFLPAQAVVRIEDGQLTARVRGEGYDPDKHGHLMEIKATTYHELEVERDPARIQVIFDI